VVDWRLDDAYDASFLDADFETIWNLNSELSDDEKTAFPDSNGFSVSLGSNPASESLNTPVHSTTDNNTSMEAIVCGDDPVLTTAGLEELLPPPLEVPCPLPDSWTRDENANAEIKREEEEKPEFLDYPIEIHAIHSYAMPPQNMLAGDEVHYRQTSSEEDESELKTVDVESNPDMKKQAEEKQKRLSGGSLGSVDPPSDCESTETAPSPITVQASRKRPAAPVLVSRKSARLPKRPKHADTDSDDDDDENVSVHQYNRAPPKDTFSNGKKKLYKSGPFRNNPDMERARINAINAKRNRDRKKQEKQSLEQEMSRLRSENQGLKRTAANLKERAASAESELQQIRRLLKLNNLEAVLKAAGNA